MEASSLELIETIAKCGAGAFGVFAALFLFLDERHKDQQETFCAWFQTKWVAVHNSPWLVLPESIITWFVNGERAMCRFVTANDMWASPPGKTGFVLACLLVPAVYWCHLGPVIGLAASLVSLPMLSGVSGRLAEVLPRWPSDVVLGAWVTAFILAAGLAAPLGLQLVIGLPTYLAALATAIAVPGMWFLLAVPVAMVVGILKDDSPDTLGRANLFSFGAALGTTATFLALAVGHAASPAAWVPQTVQMLVANLICDGLTMVATFWILAAAIAGPGFLRVPRAIVFNLIAGAVLAIASLYFGLVGTRHALSLPQLAHILIARSPDGARWEIGPYFWTMHTTFLPTLILLFVILVAWLGKALLLPVHCFFAMGREHRNPLKLTALLWGFIAAAFTGLAGIVSAFLPNGIPKP